MTKIKSGIGEGEVLRDAGMWRWSASGKAVGYIQGMKRLYVFEVNECGCSATRHEAIDQVRECLQPDYYFTVSKVLPRNHR